MKSISLKNISYDINDEVLDKLFFEKQNYIDYVKISQTIEKDLKKFIQKIQLKKANNVNTSYSLLLLGYIFSLFLKHLIIIMAKIGKDSATE